MVLTNIDTDVTRYQCLNYEFLWLSMPSHLVALKMAHTNVCYSNECHLCSKCGLKVGLK